MEVLPISSNNKVDFKSQNEIFDNNFYTIGDYVDDSNEAEIAILSKRLEAELRAAKRTHLSCGEVLLPCDLLPRISRDVLAQAESEPCGLRGCTLYVNFEGDEEPRQCMKLGVIRFDAATTATFEVFLTLKQSSTGWNSFLPQFIKKMTRSGTVMISDNYDLTKKKLYRSYVE